MSKNQVDHDRLFKELLQTFFAEFMQLFFPEAARAVDLAYVKFLQQEFFTDITAGERHRADIIVETRLKDEPGLILVHVEPQSYIQREFNERMFIYFSRLYEKYQRKILPVAVFTYDHIRNEPDSFEIGFSFLDVLRFHFYKLELKKLHWRDYVRSDNPVAAALLSKMGFKPEERVKVKVEFMRMLVRMKLDPARMELLCSFFETYLKLNRQEEEEFYQELGKIDKKEVELIMQITTSWHEKGRMEGRLEGEAVGEARGKVEKAQEIIFKFLEARFGVDTSGIREKVRQLSDLEVLDRVLAELFAVNSAEEAQRVIRDAAGGAIQ